MKRYKFTGILLLGLMSGILPSCSDKEVTDGIDSTLDDSGLSEVTFQISVSALEGSTRTPVSDPSVTISRGSLVDELIYAIYESEKGKDNFQLATYYQFNNGKGENFSFIKNEPTDIPAGHTYVGFSADNDYRHIVTLKVSQDKDYKIVCWAQSSECHAYDTSNLSDIKVYYTDNKNNKLYPNNDESRDAFYACKGFNGENRYDVISVDLKRPLAQINIGTSGADYANLIYDPQLNPHGITVTESTITVTDLANRFNAMTGEATVKKETNDGEKWTENGELVAEFTWAKLPSWFNLGGKLPSYNGFSYDVIKNNRDEDPFVKLQSVDQKEEFLYVSLNGKEGIFEDFTTIYPTLKYKLDDEGKETNVKEFLTETFKYLSMCYVLPKSVVDNTTGKAGGSPVKVNFNFRQEGIPTADGDGTTGTFELIEREIFSVPVAPNFRTNILGGLYTDKGDKHDPTSIFGFFQLPVILNDEFVGNYNERYHSANLNFFRTLEVIEEPEEIIEGEPEEDDIKYDYKDGLKVYNRTDRQELCLDNNNSLTFFFIKDEVEIEITVNEGYELRIATYAIEGSYSMGEAVENGDGTLTTLLTVGKDATAANFNIFVEKSSNE